MQTLKYSSRGEDVKLLQRRLNLIEDGVFGVLTQERVREFQRNCHLKDDGIVGPATWKYILKLSVEQDAVDMPDGLKRTARRINSIILHCTASVEGKNMNVEEIRRIHVTQRGWADIGYHYVVYLDGSVHEGRSIDKIGAHCEGRNCGSIGVVYVGGVVYKTDSSGHKVKDSNGNYVLTAKDTRTPEQKRSLVALVKKLMTMYNLSKDNIHGHYEYANKCCPSFKMEDFKNEFEG